MILNKITDSFHWEVFRVDHLLGELVKSWEFNISNSDNNRVRVVGGENTYQLPNEDVPSLNSPLSQTFQGWVYFGLVSCPDWQVIWCVSVSLDSDPDYEHHQLQFLGVEVERRLDSVETLVGSVPRSSGSTTPFNLERTSRSISNDSTTTVHLSSVLCATGTPSRAPDVHPFPRIGSLHSIYRHIHGQDLSMGHSGCRSEEENVWDSSQILIPPHRT